MELQTVVKLDKPSFRIDYSTRLMMLGSCFVENVGAKLEYFRFKTDINPCGIVYNPLSVADTLELLLTGKRFSQADLLRNGELWVSLSHHGRFSAREAWGLFTAYKFQIGKIGSSFKNDKMSW